jgi:sugar lactone lactonase YvrE
LTGTGGTVTAAPEASKLYTIADILAACVNSAGGSSGDGSSCGTLFADVVPTGGIAPTDTLQAAVYMSLNPTSTNANGSTANLTALFNLISAAPPYVGYSAPYAAGTQPTDWTVGILYTSTTALTFPQNLAIDAGGNVWIINANSKTDNLAELGPTGSPLVVAAATTTQQYRSDAIDTNGNVWFGTSSSPSSTFEYKTSGTLVSSTSYSSPYAVAIDGSNDVFVGRNSSTACSTTAVGEFTGGVITSLTSFGCPTTTADTFAYMAVDTSGNLWITNAAGSGGSGYIMEVTGVPSTVTYTQITGGSGSVPAFGEPFGVAVGTGGIWLANATGNNLTEMTSATAGTNFGSTASVNKPVFLAVDGVGNVWASNNETSPASVSEFSSTGAVLSQVSGNGAVGYSHAGMVSSYGIAIDPSGNIWVANNTASGGVFEIVGAAAPTVTPIALALKNGAAGAKP